MPEIKCKSEGRKEGTTPPWASKLPSSRHRGARAPHPPSSFLSLTPPHRARLRGKRIDAAGGTIAHGGAYAQTTGNLLGGRATRIGLYRMAVGTALTAPARPVGPL